jgi:hypothetical protein
MTEHFYRCPKAGMQFLKDNEELLTSNPPQCNCRHCGERHFLGIIEDVPEVDVLRMGIGKGVWRPVGGGV